MLPLIFGTSNKHKISVSPLYSSLSTSNITLNKLYSSLSTSNITLNNVISLKVHFRTAYFADSTVNKDKS